jgi:hypothetical protein
VPSNISPGNEIRFATIGIDAVYPGVFELEGE